MSTSAPTVTASALRADVYRILDRAIETGEVVEIERNGVVVRLVPPRPRRWIDTLPRRPEVLVGDPAELPEVGWSDAWAPELP